MKLIFLTIILATNFLFANTYSMDPNYFPCFQSTVKIVESLIEFDQQNDQTTYEDQVASTIQPFLETCKFDFNIPKNMDQCIIENLDYFQGLKELATSKSFMTAFGEFNTIFEQLASQCASLELQETPKSTIQSVLEFFHISEEIPQSQKINNLRSQ